MNFSYIQYFTFVSVIIYFAWEYADQKKIKDEREELIRLKTFELTHKATLYTVGVLSVAYVLYPPMPAFVPIILVVICCLYSEILGKYYFRRKY